MNMPFSKAKILLPKNADMPKWSVVACDQYTSEPNYWKTVEDYVAGSPSTLNLVLPEIYLENENVPERTDKIKNNMDELYNNDFFTEIETIVYVQRTLSNGTIRKGLVGKINLEDYSYDIGSQSMIRATEGTVLDRIPPRIKVREGATLELPHIMLLIDDENSEIIEPISEKNLKENMLYDFDLMENGGHICGYKLDNDTIKILLEKMAKLSDCDVFDKKYNIKDKSPLVFAVGDGNHSLATAKACYERLRKVLTPKEFEESPAKYALVEIVNLHSDALEFEPIHRVVFGVNPENVIKELYKYYNISHEKGNGQEIHYYYMGEEDIIFITNPKSNLAVGSLQEFLDEYISNNGGKIDYIHGDKTAVDLGTKENNIAFLLPAMKKNELFRTVILDGALPRKTFSMGHSFDKRYYLEARKIQ